MRSRRPPASRSTSPTNPMTTSSARRRSRPTPGRGLYTLPSLVPNKCTDMTDVADYLGKKCGGWTQSGEAYGKLDGKWIGIPVAATGGLVNYRISAMEKAGFKTFPK